MKTKKLVNLYFTEEDLKEMIIDFLAKREDYTLVEHIRDNCCSFEFCDGEFFSCSIDGELEEVEEKSYNEKFMDELDKLDDKDCNCNSDLCFNCNKEHKDIEDTKECLNKYWNKQNDKESEECDSYEKVMSRYEIYDEKKESPCDDPSCECHNNYQLNTSMMNDDTKEFNPNVYCVCNTCGKEMNCECESCVMERECKEVENDLDCDKCDDCDSCGACYPSKPKEEDRTHTQLEKDYADLCNCDCDKKHKKCY